jgi:DNA polymerase-1
MRTALIDADIVAYKAAAVFEDISPFDDENLTVWTEPEQAREEIDTVLASFLEATDADKLIICLTDPVTEWRMEYDPNYKKHRATVRRPEMLKELKGYLAETYPSYTRARLEADDVMGILSTHPKLVKGEKVIVSEDKDLRTIPGLLYNPRRPELGVIDISTLDADRFHLWQAICGDATDGIKGCPRVGPKSVYAEEIIFADREELWDIVLEAYASRGLTEEDAIHQARLARILRDTDYNFKTKKVRLWNPTFLYY